MKKIFLFIFLSFLIFAHSYKLSNKKNRLQIKKDNQCFSLNLFHSDKINEKKMNLLNLFSYHEALYKKKKYYKSMEILPNSNIFLSEKTIEQDQIKPIANISVYLQNRHNTQYLVDILIGPKKQKFNVVLDTGSSDAVINSELCVSETCHKSKKYKGKSHSPWMEKLEYGSGTILGFLSKADFYFGGKEIKNMNFFEIFISEGDDFKGLEGIIGLSLPNLSKIPNLFIELIKQKQIQEAVFSFYLNRKKEENISQVTFGGYNEKFAKSEIKYYDLKDSRFWAVESEKIMIGENDTELCSKKHKCKLIFDTGTSLIASTPENMMKIASFIEVVGNCENFQELPEIKFFIKNDIYSLDPNDYLISISEKGIKGLYDHPKKEDRVQCYAAFSVLDFEENNIFILGDIFLTKYYSIYNLKEKKIGLAKAA